MATFGCTPPFGHLCMVVTGIYPTMIPGIVNNLNEAVPAAYITTNVESLQRLRNIIPLPYDVTRERGQTYENVLNMAGARTAYAAGSRGRRCAPASASTRPARGRPSTSQE